MIVVGWLGVTGEFLGMPLQQLCDLTGGLWSTQRFADLWFCFLVMGPVSVWGGSW